ncbi:hypothetical protein F9K91_06420 [Brucella tritici]|uniref:Uncharacterized protein n=1 Tax=Brucella tritici TaxID=94626 RepID=A0A833FQP8_9HYPH|nr:hypothetical protein [Brucella tritici]KAB2666238.1 hypothetical protein F9K91_06420 [Brucella tritici]
MIENKIAPPLEMASCNFSHTVFIKQRKCFRYIRWNGATSGSASEAISRIKPCWNSPAVSIRTLFDMGLSARTEPVPLRSCFAPFRDIPKAKKAGLNPTFRFHLSLRQYIRGHDPK